MAKTPPPKLIGANILVPEDLNRSIKISAAATGSSVKETIIEWLRFAESKLSK